MKRAAGRVKRKKAGTGAKGKSPRLRAAKVSPASPRAPRPAARRKTVAKVKRPKPRRVIAKRKTSARKPRPKIPAFLLEGDESELQVIGGPGEKFALGPETPAAHFTAGAAHLPATYGTGRLFLTARDPHWLYAHWDIHTTTQFQHNARSVDRHLILRMHEDELGGKTCAEIHVHPESRHWFAHVESAGTKYIADLGYYQSGHKWKSIATSAPMRTPTDTVSTDTTAEFATIPLDLPFETMLRLLKESDQQQLPLAHAIDQLRRQSHEFPAPEKMAVWTQEQERGLAEILAAGHSRRGLHGSEEITGPGEQSVEDSAAVPGSFDVSSYLGGENISSPPGGGEQVSREFWFNVNAELVIYGATEPDAKVTVGGRSVPLQADGSFSLRYSLPDGQYELPVVAVSADETDGRAAELTFARATQLLGNVGVHPQDPALSPPDQTSD